MPIIKSESYLYGADLDGNRGIWLVDTYVYSDVSGKDLTGEDYFFVYDDKIMSLDELKEALNVKVIVSGIYTCQCGDELDAEEVEVYDIDNEVYCDNCLYEYLYSYSYTLESLLELKGEE